jgi:4-cresol dehydrogenase (hydroxylating)
VRAVLRDAVQHRTPLYPVSRGCNWGYGSHLPFRDGSVLLDLSALDAIGEIDRDSLSVRIEPGVTQAALFEYLRLHAPDLAMNVTGAGRVTSVLGNALDRGMGYSGEKDQDVYALEVLLADGTTVGPVEGRNHRSRAHPAGLSVDALFFQSNFGIVVGARLRLRIRQEAEEAVIVQGPFESVIGTLKQAYEERLIVSPTHVAEPGRSRRLGFGLLRTLWAREPTAREVDRCFPEQNSFNGLVPIYGRQRVVNAAWREIKRCAKAGTTLRRVNARTLEFGAKWLARGGARYKAARILALRPILAFCWGEPSDAGMSFLDEARGVDPNLASRGAIYGNAVSSTDPGKAEQAALIVRSRWNECAFTWILIDSKCMITIYTLHFDEGAAAEAHAASAAIIEEHRAAGFPQYRLDINTAAARGADPVVRRLKAAFDPLDLIAPGRYESQCGTA